MDEELVNYLVKNKYFDFLFINEPLYKKLKYCKIKTLIIATYNSPSNNYLNIKDKIFDIISLYYEKHFESPIYEILDNSYFQKKWLKTFNNFLFEKIDSIGIEI